MRFKFEDGKVYRLHMDTGERLLGIYSDRTVTGLLLFLFPWSPGFIPVSQDRIAQCECVVTNPPPEGDGK